MPLKRVDHCDRVPPLLYRLAALLLMLLAGFFVTDFSAAGAAAVGLFLAAVLVLPTALLLHAGGIKAPQ